MNAGPSTPAFFSFLYFVFFRFLFDIISCRLFVVLFIYSYQLIRLKKFVKTRTHNCFYDGVNDEPCGARAN